MELSAMLHTRLYLVWRILIKRFFLSLLKLLCQFKQLGYRLLECDTFEFGKISRKHFIQHLKKVKCILRVLGLTIFWLNLPPFCSIILDLKFVEAVFCRGQKPADKELYLVLDGLEHRHRTSTQLFEQIKVEL